MENQVKPYTLSPRPLPNGERGLFFVFFICFGSLIYAHDQITTLAGNIQGIVYLENRVNIITTVIVEKEAVLKIKPGSALVFLNPEARLIVYGSIQALGDRGEPIYFESPLPDTKWVGIKLKDSKVRSVFKYCRFRRSEVALEIEDSFVFIWQCRFLENRSTLLIRGEGTQLLVKESSFINNQFNLPQWEKIKPSQLIFQNSFWGESDKFDVKDNQTYNRETEPKILGVEQDPTNWRTK